MSYPVNPTPPLPFPSSSADPYALAAFDQDLVRALHAYLSDLARRINDMLPKNGSESMSGPLTISNVAGDLGNVWGGRLLTLSNFAPGIYLQDRTAAAVDALLSLDADQLKFFSTTAGDGSDLVVRYTFNMSSGFGQWAGQYLTHTGTASVAGTNHAFQIGDTASTNLIADKEGIIARNNGATSTLYLQKGGGVTSVGSSTGGDGVTILTLEQERSWSFRQRGTGGAAALSLEANVAGKHIDIRDSAGNIILSVGDDTNIRAYRQIDLQSGNIAFPSTQVPSSNANILDDYEEGTWTVAFSFATPGDLNIAYSAREGRYIKIGKQVTIWFMFTTSTFTYTTAGGAVTLTGLPFTSANIATTMQWTGSIEVGPVTLAAGHTWLNLNLVNNSSAARIVASGSAARAALTTSNFPTGTNFTIIGSLAYEAAS